MQIATAANNVTPLAPAAQAKSNKPSFDDILAHAVQLGTEFGKGRDTQIKFDLMVIEAAYKGTLTVDPNKHGTGRNDAHVLAEAYAKGQHAGAIFDVRSDSGRKLVSNLLKCIKFGCQTKWDPLQIANDFVSFRQSERKDPAKAKKLDDAHNALMRLLTAQNKSQTLLPDAERNAFAYKAAPELRTVIEVLDSIRKVATKLAQGKAGSCPDADDSAEVRQIADLCTARIRAILTKHNPNPAPGTPLAKQITPSR